MIEIPLITLGLIYLAYWKANDRRFGIVTLLIATYVIMSCAAIVLERTRIFQGSWPIEFEPMAFLSLGFAIIFWGFSRFRERTFKSIRIENIGAYRALEVMLVVGGVSAIMFFLPFAASAMRGDISLNRADNQDAVVRLAAYGVLNSIFSLLSNLFIVAQMGFFINLIPVNGKRRLVRAYVLLFSSLSFVVYILAYAGRDGVVYWLMSYLFCYLLFREFIPKGDLRRIQKTLLLIVACLLIPFWMISVSRFNEMPGGTALQIINYGGMQLRHFGNQYAVSFPLQHGRFNFPVIYDVLALTDGGGASRVDQTTFNSYFLDQGLEPWVFTTFIGSFLLDFGKAGTLLLLCCLCAATRRVLKKVTRTGTLDYSDLLLFIVLYQCVYWGVFYFRLYVANYYVIGMILLCCSFKLVESPRLAIQLAKIPVPFGRGARLTRPFKAHQRRRGDEYQTGDSV